MQNIVDYIAAKLSITSERGVTTIEYGLIAALVAVAIVGVVTLVGSKLTNTFNTVANGLK
jgi:pilus assembly protein Flp/PilA